MARPQFHHRPRGDIPGAQLSSRLPGGLTIRDARPGDRPFLRRLHAESEAAALIASAGLDDLVALQYDARDREFAERFPGASDSIVLCDGAPVGRLWVDRSGSAAWRLLDLAVVAERRRQGIATAVLAALLADAADARARVVLTVERRNTTAVRLYRRLGFEDDDGDAVHRWMVYRPSRDESP